MAQNRRVLKVYMTRQFLFRFLHTYNKQFEIIEKLQNCFFHQKHEGFSPKSPMSTQNCIIVVATIFPRKNRKNVRLKLEKERETGRCLQSQGTNHVSTKTRTKTKYHTSCSQNVYVLICVFVLAFKAKLSTANATSSVGNETNGNRTFLYRPHHLH